MKAKTNDNLSLTDVFKAQFILGVGTGVGIIATFQDWLGLEKYTEHIQTHWLDLHWSIPAAYVCLMVFMAVRLAKRKTKWMT